MLNARYLASVSDDLVKLYANLEADIKKNMAKRILKLEKVSDSDEYQAEMLKQIGAFKNDILKYCDTYNEKAGPMLEKAFNEAMAKATKNDLKYYAGSKVGETTFTLSENQKQVMDASLERFGNSNEINKTFATQQKVRSSFDDTYKSIQRMTLTVADSSQTNFLREMNNAYMAVSSGASSYDEAYKKAVDNLAADGTSAISYSGSGRPHSFSVEAAVRMNVLTGINQTAAQQTIDNCAKLDTDLVEVSAHIGARDKDGKNPWSNHAKWQGKVYCLNGERDYIDENGETKHAPNFQESCGLGEADGICGINCRHSYYPYFEGTPTMYSKNELDEYKEATVDYYGDKMSVYEAEQEQRYYERKIRQTKSKIEMEELTGFDSTADRVLLGQWQAALKDWTDETGLRKDSSRTYIGTKSGEQPKALKEIKTRNYGTSQIQTKQDVKDLLKSRKVQSINITKHQKTLNNDEIIKNLAGGDMTAGSCSSLAFAFAANKAGYNVLDFRGGASREIFATDSTIDVIANLPGVNGNVIKQTNDFKAAKQLMNQVQEGKLYYFTTGQHASIIRKTKKGFQYLELQSQNKYGFKDFEQDTLRDRFGCQSSHSSYGVKYDNMSALIDIENLYKSKDFLYFMRYINTQKNRQKKSAKGGIK